MRNSLKNYLLKTSIIIMTLLMAFSCMPVKASTGDDGISPCAYYAPGEFSFTGWTQNVKYYDGKYMAVEITATSNIGNSQNMTVEVYVAKTGKTYTYTMKTNGLTKKYDYIPLGNDGGSDAIIILSCSNHGAVVTAKVISYSWN